MAEIYDVFEKLPVAIYSRIMLIPSLFCFHESESGVFVINRISLGEHDSVVSIVARPTV